MFRFLTILIICAAVAIGAGYIFYRGGNQFMAEYSNGVPKNPEVKTSGDLPNQKPLANPPSVIKAIYATSWSAGSPTRLNSLIKLINDTELNAIVIDIKDYSGAILYDINVPEVNEYKAKEIRIPNINTVIKKLHDAGIYVIARITVFQDPLLAAARPDLAIQNNSTGKLWKDRKGLAWIDPASDDAWAYNVSIGKDAAARGFDELNFDYVRFPSDGDLTLMEFPFHKPEAIKRADMIHEFFAYLRAEFPTTKISADLFGLVTINNDDLGIGQKIELAYENFDAVAPMIYPSHYANGFLGYPLAAKYPYEVIRYSMDHAIQKLLAISHSPIANSENSDISATSYQLQAVRLRPWLQDFDLGGVPYGIAEVKAQMKALDDSFCLNANSPAPQCKTANVEKIKATYGGWMLWDPSNHYTTGALSAQ